MACSRFGSGKPSATAWAAAAIASSYVAGGEGTSISRGCPRSSAAALAALKSIRSPDTLVQFCSIRRGTTVPNVNRQPGARSNPVEFRPVPMISTRTGATTGFICPIGTGFRKGWLHDGGRRRAILGGRPRRSGAVRQLNGRLLCGLLSSALGRAMVYRSSGAPVPSAVRPIHATNARAPRRSLRHRAKSC